MPLFSGNAPDTVAAATVLFIHQTNHLPKVVCFSSVPRSLSAMAELSQLSGARGKPSVSRCPARGDEAPRVCVCSHQVASPHAAG